MLLLLLTGDLPLKEAVIDAAVPQADDLVIMGAQSRVVGHHDDGHILFPVQFVKKFHDLIAGFFVKVACGFISQDKGGTVAQRTGNGDTLTLTA